MLMTVAVWVFLPHGLSCCQETNWRALKNYFPLSDSDLAYLPTEMKPECLKSFPSLMMKIRDSTLGRWSFAVILRGGRRPPTT
jgi:hypothetical protein